MAGRWLGHASSSGTASSHASMVASGASGRADSVRVAPPESFTEAEPAVQAVAASHTEPRQILNGPP